MVEYHINVGDIDLSVTVDVTQAVTARMHDVVYHTIDVSDIDLSVTVQVLYLPLQGRNHNRFAII